MTARASDSSSLPDYVRIISTPIIIIINGLTTQTHLHTLMTQPAICSEFTPAPMQRHHANATGN